ncbi:MAG: MFS transporter [Polyangiaceae bacterium]
MSAPISDRPRASVGSPAAASRLLTPAFVHVLAAQLSIGFGFSLYFLLPKYLATELQAGPASIGNVAASGLAAAVATTPLMGYWLDRYGHRKSMALSAVLVMLASLGMLRVTSVDTWLYALRLVQGLGFALGFNAAAAYVAEIAPEGRLGQAMGLLGAGSLLTNAIAPALFESAALRWGWQPVFGAAAATGVATLLLALSLPPAPRVASAAHVSSAAVDTPPLRIAIVTAATGAAFGTLITFTQPFALARGAERVSTYLIGYTLGALFVRVGLGSLSDRAGRRRVAQWALAAYGSMALVTALLEPRLLFVLGVGFGVAHGFVYPALAALAAEGAHPARRGRTLANFNAAFNCGAGVALLGGGWVARAAGYPTLFALVGLCTLLSVSSLTAPAPRLLAPPESKR